MDEATLRALGLTPGATAEQIASAVAALNTKTAELEAKAKAEAQARLEAEAKAEIAEAARAAKEQAAAEAKALADYTAEVQAFLADVTDGPKATFEKMAFSVEIGPDGKERRKPNPDGLASAKTLADTMVGARKSSLAGPSKQVAAARQVATSSPQTTVAKGPVKYRFAGATQEIDLTRLTGVTPEALAQRMAEMEARAEARGQRVND